MSGIARHLRCAAVLLVPVVAALAQSGEGPLRYGQVFLPGEVALQVEIADTPLRRARGYMFRDAVGPEDGMLFLFEDEEIHSFWMKNVRIHLDILWISGDGTVVHVEANVPPCRADPCPSVVPMAQASRVLELAGGRAAELELAVGSLVEFLLPPAP